MNTHTGIIQAMTEPYDPTGNYTPLTLAELAEIGDLPADERPTRLAELRGQSINELRRKVERRPRH